MHDVRIPLDHHFVVQLHAAGFGHAADIVAAQVDEHQVLGDLLGVLQQVLLQRQIGLCSGAAWAGAGDGSHRNLAILDPDQNLG